MLIKLFENSPYFMKYWQVHTFYQNFYVKKDDVLEKILYNVQKKYLQHNDFLFQFYIEILHFVKFDRLLVKIQQIYEYFEIKNSKTGLCTRDMDQTKKIPWRELFNFTIVSENCITFFHWLQRYRNFEMYV